MFWMEKWKNFVDQSNISKVMLDLVWRDFVKFEWLGVHRQGRIWPTIWPTSFCEFFKVYDKKSQNDSEGVDIALK